MRSHEQPSTLEYRRQLLEKVKKPLAGAAAAAIMLSSAALGPHSDERSPIAPPEFSDTIVSMGDSLTAGPGILPYEKGTGKDGNQCYRGSTNYTAEIAKRLGAHNIVNVACSGATVDEIRDGKNGGKSQLEALSSTTDIVFLDAYLNDKVRFQFTFDQCKSKEGCGADSAYYNAVEESIANPTDIENLANLYREVLEKAPNAHVFIMEYPDVLGNPAVRFFAKQQAGDGIIDIATMVIKKVNSAIEQAAIATDNERLTVLPSVDVGTHFFKPSDGHPEAILHPNKAGQEKLADKSYPIVSEILGKKALKNIDLQPKHLRLAHRTHR